MKRTFCLLTLVVSLVAGTGLASAQGQPPVAAPGSVEELLAFWDVVSKGLVQMAEHFPEDKYDYRPTPEVRSVAELILHVAHANYLFSEIAQGQKPSTPPFSREKYKTKAACLAALKKSFDDAAAVLREMGNARMSALTRLPNGKELSAHEVWMMAIIHGVSHRGNLVTYSRLNGLAPPPMPEP